MPIILLSLRSGMGCGKDGDGEKDWGWAGRG